MALSRRAGGALSSAGAGAAAREGRRLHEENHSAAACRLGWEVLLRYGRRGQQLALLALLLVEVRYPAFCGRGEKAEADILRRNIFRNAKLRCGGQRFGAGGSCKWQR